MDFGFDNFITYPDSPNLYLPKNHSDADDFLPVNYLSTPDMNQFGSFPSDSGQTHSTSPPSSDSYSSKVPFTIIKKKSNEELKQVSLTTKQIKKKAKAQERAERKDKELNNLLAKASKKYIPPALYDPNLDPKTKRHLIQVVKNRMAAQQTRDRRKNEQEEVVEVKGRLEEENRRLLQQNSYLMDRVRALEEAQARILAENAQLKNKSSFDIDFNNSRRQSTINEGPIVIDISDEDRATMQLQSQVGSQINLGERGETILTRGSNKKTPYGYLFTLTTILMVFQTIRMNPVPPGKIVPEGGYPPPPPPDEPYHDPHSGERPFPGGHDNPEGHPFAPEGGDTAGDPNPGFDGPIDRSGTDEGGTDEGTMTTESFGPETGEEGFGDPESGREDGPDDGTVSTFSTGEDTGGSSSPDSPSDGAPSPASLGADTTGTEEPEEKSSPDDSGHHRPQEDIMFSNTTLPDEGNNSTHHNETDISNSIDGVDSIQTRDGDVESTNTGSSSREIDSTIENETNTERGSSGEGGQISESNTNTGNLRGSSTSSSNSSLDQETNNTGILVDQPENED